MRAIGSSTLVAVLRPAEREAGAKPRTMTPKTHPRGNGVLQRKTCGVPDVWRGVVIDKLSDEHHHVRGLHVVLWLLGTVGVAPGTSGRT